ncbi:YebC/PmpR family DNA-binding transcriptional regulator [Candidatus Parcubacteria bacterium]|nr:YebC/PmpR family DNA-binding transcriptional regulator [Candidatus Parcubacteria bacterium]
MSGHSKWAKVKHQKAITDARKGKNFSKLAKMISVAAREGGSGDPATNAKLRIAVEKAHDFNMPADNIDRAIKRGTGEDKSAAQIEEILLEAYGPGGVPLLIKVVTDNRNRALAEIRHILADHGGKLGESGSVRWMFGLKGVVRFAAGTICDEECELTLIDAGAEDIRNSDGYCSVISPPENLEALKQATRALNKPTEEAGLEWIAKNPAPINPGSENALEKLYDALDESDDVADVYGG